MILYGVTTQTSIPELFIAGFGPGILIAGALIATVLVWCRLRGWGKQDGEGRLPFLRALREAGFALVMPVVVLGGIYGGVTTPTEASVVAVVANHENRSVWHCLIGAVAGHADDVLVLDGQEAVETIGNPKTLNVIMLGAALESGALDFLTEEDVLEAIREKVKPKFVALNEKALRYAFELARP